MARCRVMMIRGGSDCGRLILSGPFCLMHYRQYIPRTCQSTCSPCEARVDGAKEPSLDSNDEVKRSKPKFENRKLSVDTANVREDASFHRNRRALSDCDRNPFENEYT